MENPKAYTGKDKYIFISYSHKDNDRVFPIISALQEKYNVWFDEGIHFGTEWEDEIADRLLNCELFIFIVSPNSLDSENCKDEIHLAREKEKNFINLILEEFEFPSFFELRYSRYQSCEYYRYKNDKDAIDEMERKCNWFDACKKVIEEKETSKTNKYIYPSLDLLTEDDNDDVEKKCLSDKENQAAANKRIKLINKFFKDNDLKCEIKTYNIGPCYARLYVELNKELPSDIDKYTKDIQTILGGVHGVAFTPVIEGLKTPSFDIPNEKVETVNLKSALKQLPAKEKLPSTLCLGKDIIGQYLNYDFVKFPHLLLIGLTGSGRTMFLNNIILSLAMRNSPDNLKFILLDTNGLNFIAYHDLPHLYQPIANRANDLMKALEDINSLIAQRYDLLITNKCLDIDAYNSANKDKLQRIVVILDEYGEAKDVNPTIDKEIIKICEKGEAAGVHLFLSVRDTQAHNVSNTLKANFTSKISFRLTKEESVSLFKSDIAERLIGNGDAIISLKNNAQNIIHLHTPFISDQDILNVVGFITGGDDKDKKAASKKKA